MSNYIWSFSAACVVLFTSKLDLNFRNKLVNCYIWSIVLSDVET